MPLFDSPTGNVCYQLDQLIDRHHFFGPDVDGAGKVRAQQPHATFDAFFDIEERARLFTIAPHLDLFAAPSHGNLATNRSRRLFAAASPSPLWSKYIVVARDMCL